MALNMKPTKEIISRLGLQPSGPVHKFFTQTCAIHMDKYLPFRTGTLATTVIVNGTPTDKVKPNRIIYAQKYAVYVYKGVRNGKELNYRLDKHPLAGPYWDRRMVTAEMPKVEKEVQKYVRTRGGK